MNYEPGTVAVATVRGVPNVRVFRRGRDWVSARLVEGWFTHFDSCVTDIRPGIVLDLDGIDAVELAREIRDARDSWADIADQIAGHAKPRFPLGAHVRYIGDNPVVAWRKRRSKKHLGIVIENRGSDYVRVYDTVENEWWVADEGSLGLVMPYSRGQK